MALMLVVQLEVVSVGIMLGRGTGATGKEIEVGVAGC